MDTNPSNTTGSCCLLTLLAFGLALTVLVGVLIVRFW